MAWNVNNSQQCIVQDSLSNQFYIYTPSTTGTATVPITAATINSTPLGQWQPLYPHYDANENEFETKLDNTDIEPTEKMKLLLDKAHKELQEKYDALEILKKDIQDLKRGKLEQIKTRHRKHEKFDKYSPITVKRIEKIEGIDQVMRELKGEPEPQSNPNPFWQQIPSTNIPSTGNIGIIYTTSSSGSGTLSVGSGGCGNITYTALPNTSASLSTIPNISNGSSNLP